jgi:hypothetical protein
MRLVKESKMYGASSEIAPFVYFGVAIAKSAGAALLPPGFPVGAFLFCYLGALRPGWSTFHGQIGIGPPHHISATRRFFFVRGTPCLLCGSPFLERDWHIAHYVWIGGEE